MIFNVPSTVKVIESHLADPFSRESSLWPLVKPTVSMAALCSMVVILLLFNHCLLLPLCVGILFLFVKFLVSFLNLKSTCCGRERSLLYFNDVLAVVWLSVFCVSSSGCRWLVGLSSVIVSFPWLTLFPGGMGVL